MDVTPDTDAADPRSPARAEVPPDRDVANIVSAEWPARDLPRVRDQRAAGFQAVITRSALNDMHRHGRSQRDVEVCGVLVGNVYRDEKGPYLYVESSIRGDHAAGKTAQVTFTAETWNHITDVMERDFPGRKILGWYHTHPGFGIFLSEMDLFIQNNFFPELWQAAYVYDPQSGEDGLFVWKNGQATRDAYLTDPDAINSDPPDVKREAAPTTATLAELTGRVQTLEQKVRWLVGGLFLVAVLALLSPMLTDLLLPPEHGGDTREDVDVPLSSIPESLRPPPATMPSQ